ncbi:hypothetical protein [Rahnella aceris]|uniref:hypothetical protein n=1 Tax=Rahnella sp. (strain Y9602) TaxID=2703885 RepID=UPI0020B8617A|nr:hypothetical protein [Rahnella aceris]
MPALCFANITVSPMKVTLNERHATTLVISSKSETTQYIQGKITEVHNPGTAEENETPAPQGAQNSLVVSPLKFGLPAGNSQPVRIVGLGESNEEKIYRVHFQSMTPEEFKNPASNKNFTSELNLTIVWGGAASKTGRQTGLGSIHSANYQYRQYPSAGTAYWPV